MAAVGCLHLLCAAFVCPEVKPHFHPKTLSLCTGELEFLLSWKVLARYLRQLWAWNPTHLCPSAPLLSLLTSGRTMGAAAGQRAPREERGGKSWEPCLKSVGQGFGTVWVLYVPIPLLAAFALIKHFGSGFWSFYDAGWQSCPAPKVLRCFGGMRWIESVSKTGLGVCDGLQTGWLILGRGACPELGEHPEIFLLKLHEI